MSLPIILKQGQVSIYGAGSVTGITGVQAPDGYSFGIIDQVWNGGTGWPFVGDSVCFKGDDIIKLVYGSWPYLLIDETKILMTETPLL